jgi:uncharacterized membrane protein
MTHQAIYLYACGALATLAGVAGLFFFRFWATTRDRFFVFFAVAFWLLAANWTVLAAVPPYEESVHPAYVVRLAAFLLLVVAIVDKNRKE